MHDYQILVSLYLSLLFEQFEPRSAALGRAGPQAVGKWLLRMAMCTAKRSPPSWR